MKFTEITFQGREGVRSKLLFFSIAYLPELASDHNKKISTLTFDTKNVLVYQISVQLYF